eukprot:CAMPEP_0181432678 /NCGR_PEP_ID=MMETSP1110-20121109/18895_1 /TAXON_ID=174948 /ORGANISM="Symbiodinium sp., Strain CCMP421" /LENGTH=231 /DNA_ID=CAMNT_0023556097 /DNA_START=48 /DNA_END=739 /DNA_ORIENTATION=+
MTDTMVPAGAEASGTCTAFNAAKGFGFIDMAGATVFVHNSDCEEGKQPKVGDLLTFTVEPRRNNPEQMCAKNVKGCSEDRQPAWGPGGGGGAWAGPVEGTGAHTGSVKSFGSKGYGFITMDDGAEMFFNVRDCVGSKPIAGDKVKFDICDSERNPGHKQATNVTGGSQPLDAPHGVAGGGGYGAMGGAWGGDWGWGGGKGMWGGGKGWGMKGGLKGGMMMANGPYGKGGYG